VHYVYPRGAGAVLTAAPCRVCAVASSASCQYSIELLPACECRPPLSLRLLSVDHLLQRRGQGEAEQVFDAGEELNAHQRLRQRHLVQRVVLDRASEPGLAARCDARAVDLDVAAVEEHVDGAQCVLLAEAKSAEGRRRGSWWRTAVGGSSAGPCRQGLRVCRRHRPSRAPDGSWGAGGDRRTDLLLRAGCWLVRSPVRRAGRIESFATWLDDIGGSWRPPARQRDVRRLGPGPAACRHRSPSSTGNGNIGGSAGGPRLSECDVHRARQHPEPAPPQSRDGSAGRTCAAMSLCANTPFTATWSCPDWSGSGPRAVEGGYLLRSDLRQMAEGRTFGRLRVRPIP